jgi:hypothetical protein
MTEGTGQTRYRPEGAGHSPLSLRSIGYSGALLGVEVKRFGSAAPGQREGEKFYR